MPNDLSKLHPWSLDKQHMSIFQRSCCTCPSSISPWFISIYNYFIIIWSSWLKMLHWVKWWKRRLQLPPKMQNRKIWSTESLCDQFDGLPIYLYTTKFRQFYGFGHLLRRQTFIIRTGRPCFSCHVGGLFNLSSFGIPLFWRTPRYHIIHQM